MTIQIFDGLFGGGLLSPTDLTADEKKRLYQWMQGLGASESFTYTRCFRDGFAQWELMGVWQAKVEYLRLLHTEEKVPIEVRCVETVKTEDGETYRYRHFYEVDGEERSFDITAKGDFWRFLGDVRRRYHFGEYMARLCMRSKTTVTKRSSVDDWRDYELSGIRSSIQMFVESEQEAAKDD